MSSLKRTLQTAWGELSDAVRSRRALVMMCLYLLFGVCCMYTSTSALGKMERELASVLKLPETEKAGVVSATLWKSQPFRKLVKAAVRDDLVYRAIEGRHPAELIYAWFAFFCAPLLVVLVAGNRVAEDLGSGAVRYAIVRCTRMEWTMGKYLGQAGMIGVSLVVGAIGAWTVAVFRLSGVDALKLLPSMVGWGLKAWLCSLSWLGLAMGISHVTKSGSRATGLGLLAMVAMLALPGILALNADYFELPWLKNFEVISPSSATRGLWRNTFTPIAAAAIHLIMLGMGFLTLGHEVFSRRDA